MEFLKVANEIAKGTRQDSGQRHEEFHLHRPKVLCPPHNGEKVLYKAISHKQIDRLEIYCAC